MRVCYTLLYTLLFLGIQQSFCQTQKDTIFAVRALEPVLIDGSDSDACWSNTEWHPISQVWIPYGAKMANGDFAGKFKVAWDNSYLYVLVEVVDDMISDDHANPLQNWWDDDCVEVFIDENRSKGYHEKNNNAFAYHVSTKYDAIDMDSKGNGINYKDHIQVVMDTISEHTYLWEMAIKIYDASFTVANPEASRVVLTSQKLMGFTIAYCDNDDNQSKTRENFIGSMYMTSATANNNYITADYFGSLVLADHQDASTGNKHRQASNHLFEVLSVPSADHLILKKVNEAIGPLMLEIYTINGVLVKSVRTENQSQKLRLSELKSGIYILKISAAGQRQTERFLID